VSLLGDSTVFISQTVNFLTGVNSGVATFTATDGSGNSILADILGTGIPINLFQLELNGLFTFTGGTGLFAGATGQAPYAGTVTFTGPSSAISAVSFAGTVSQVPEEPTSIVLLISGLVVTAARRRIRRG